MKPRLRQPETLLATWFGAGLAPAAPGTFGSLAAFPLALPIAWAFGWVGLVVAAAAITLVGLWAADRYGQLSGKDDAQEIVIDEVAAQLFVLAAAPFEFLPWCAAFLAFRLFDVWKPWPCSALDRRLHGGLGVMADDLAAAGYAALVMYGLGEGGAWG